MVFTCGWTCSSGTHLGFSDACPRSPSASESPFITLFPPASQMGHSRGSVLVPFSLGDALGPSHDLSPDIHCHLRTEDTKFLPLPHLLPGQAPRTPHRPLTSGRVHPVPRTFPSSSVRPGTFHAPMVPPPSLPWQKF